MFLAIEKPIMVLPRLRYREWFTNDEFYELFRFEMDDFERLVNLFGLPENESCRDGHLYFHRIDGFLVILLKLAFPVKWLTVRKVFFNSFTKSQLSSIFTCYLKIIHARCSSQVDLLDVCFSPERLTLYSQCLQAKGCDVPDVCGFIDGTFVYTARPIRGQESCYNGWKKGHGLKFQVLSFPDGLIGSFYGPQPGRRHDAYLVNESHIKTIIQDIRTFTNINVKIYCDQGYSTDEIFVSRCSRFLTSVS